MGKIVSLYDVSFKNLTPTLIKDLLYAYACYTVKSLDLTYGNRDVIRGQAAGIDSG